MDLSYSKPAPAGVVCRRYQEEYEERLKEQERRRWEKERRSRERTKKEIDREFRDFGLPFLFLQFLHCFSVNFAGFFLLTVIAKRFDRLDQATVRYASKKLCLWDFFGNELSDLDRV